MAETMREALSGFSYPLRSVQHRRVGIFFSVSSKVQDT